MKKITNYLKTADNIILTFSDGTTDKIDLALFNEWLMDTNRLKGSIPEYWDAKDSILSDLGAFWDEVWVVG